MRTFTLIIVAGLLLSASPIVAQDSSGNRFIKKTYTYKQVGDLEIKADVYRPDDDVKRPVLMWIHGGALIMGGRQGVQGNIAELAGREGFVLVSIDYRLAPQAKIAEITSDVADALKWIHEKGPELFNADPSRLVVAGGSAGGYLTLYTGTLTPRPTALVAYYGYGTLDSPWYAEPSEFYRRAPLVSEEDAWKAAGDKLLANGGERPGGGRFYLYCRQNGLWPKHVTGFDPKTEREKIKPYCPTYNVTKDYPPTMLLHGTADTDVPHEESEMIAKVFERKKVWHEFLSLTGFGHGLFPGDDPHMRQVVREAHERAEWFITHHLKGGQ